MLYTIRSERQLVNHIEFDMPFRWFVGLGIDDRCGAPAHFRRSVTGF
ncbi:MAG: transposase [Alphaproteobacteria bacterium]|nr:transposase [Alphaproteobacteria bacterium]